MIRLVAALLLAAALPAHAHVFGAHGAGFAAGFVHPFGGLDHMLAMVAVGAWAARLGGRAVWALPLAFAGTMVAGGVLGAAGVPLPSVETGIALTVVLLGLFVAFAWAPPAPIAAVLVALFALLHGHAHGTELSQAADAAGYAAGFVIATLLLHGAGVAGGLALRPLPAMRLAGAATAAAGLVLMVGG